MKTKIHAIAGVIGFLTILTFWTSTVYSELFASHETIAAVKSMILKGMFILIPAMAIAGGSGMSLGGKRVDEKAVAKKKRMPLIAANGLLILVPAALYLESKASSGAFDMSFYLVQGLELVAGAANLVMMGLNIRDGLTMTGRLGGQSKVVESKSGGSVIEELDGGPLVAKNLPRLFDANSEPLEIKPVVALCRCGASQIKPYCDGSHNEIGFDSTRSENHTPDKLRSYKGRDITIHYNRLLCSHAGECGKHLKSVFDPSREPWIVPDNGSKEEIIATVKTCPSGALMYSLDGSSPQHEVGGETGIDIEKDGPYRVVGIPLTSSHFAEGSSPNKYVLCRCGASKNKPFCDGSHQEIKWRDAE